MNRKQRRAISKIFKKSDTKKLSDKLTQFDRLPDNCSACIKPYDKKDKKMAMTWSVVVRDEENTVRLYCPDCWSKATNLVKEIGKELNEKANT